MKCEDNIHFHTLLESVRDYRGITMEQLCSGLCSVSQMYYIQSGARLPDYLMRNRIMARLGISAEGYEDYVQYDEYERWCGRQQIITLIEDSKWEEASLLLNEIDKAWKKKSKIEKQFILDMNARLSIYNGASCEELLNIYEKIVDLTVEGLFKDTKKSVYLSQVEYYYVINYLYYKYKVNSDNRNQINNEFQAIINYILISPLEGIAKAKILPMAVTMYYEVVKENTASFDAIWKYSSEAVEILKETERSYYLKELVNLRNEIISISNKKYDISVETQVFDIIEYLEQKYDVNIAMWQNGYIYRDSQVSCIADVIRSRRKMFNITRSELSDGICSERTLERIEAKHSKPQQYVMKALFDKLFLVGEYRRTEIITSDIGLINRFNKYKEKINQKRYDEAIEEADYVINNLDRKYISNEQTIRRIKNTIGFLSKQIDKEEYISNLEESLSLSGIGNIFNKEYCYLTNGEMVILHNIELQQKDKVWQREILNAHFSNMDDVAFYSSFAIYELVKDWEASQLGNRGLYDESYNISINIISTSLRLCKIHGLYRALSNMAWNVYELNKTDEAASIYNTLLMKCITLCDFSSNKLAEAYKKELKK